ncbi:MAG: methionine ABC transporter ATP-binding protein [Tissierellia bacterium]|nr:methionine ABC transporter ATP-binding protein [Tissierellia bacterium]
MIEVKNLVKEYETDSGPIRAIDQVSFKVDKGEIYGIIGLSGAGKSTLVRCLNRLEEATSGEIMIDGVSILDLSQEDLLKERKGIGMIFQHFNLFMQKTVYKNIAYPLEISAYPKEEIKSRVEALLKFIDLEDKKEAYPAQLSGGQRQRVAIARAIATRPKVLLSDEGTSALDPANTQVVLDLLRDIVKEFGTTIIMITHQMEVAQDICDRIAVMENGAIIEENTTEELFKNPKHRRTRTFIRGLSEYGEKEEEKLDLSGDIYRLTYSEGNVKDPILSQLIKNFDLQVNLLSGSVTQVKNQPRGYMVVEIRGQQDEKERALAFLREQKVHVEKEAESHE